MAVPIAAAAKVVGQRLVRRVVGRKKRPRRKKNHLGLWIFIGFIGFISFTMITTLLSLATMGGGGGAAAIKEQLECDTTAQVGNPTPGPEGLGEMPTSISASPGGPVNGNVTIANANIKGDAGFNPGVHALAGPSPDFITLNEIETVSLPRMKSAVSGYDAFRPPLPSGEDASQAMGSAIMWRSDTWTMLDGGRVKIADDDHVIFKGARKNWDRFAVWGVFQRSDGAVVGVIATHHMTNPFKFPNSQWGNQPFTRAEQYGQGMDYLIQLTNILAAYGPVFVGGDMNSHPNDGPNAAVAKMAAAGYAYTKDSGVIYNFYAAPVTVQRTWEISKAAVHSDHPALFTRMAMNGAAPDGDPVGSDDNGSSGDVTDVSDVSDGCCPTTGTGYTGEGTKIATFNILGASHTDGKGGGGGRGGKEHRGYYPDHTWDKRLPEALNALKTHGVSIAGLQEVAPPQGRALARNSEWDVWPTSGDQAKVLWDPNQWQMTDHRLPQIKYFKGTVGMPVVKLTSQTGEGSVWVMSVHNPIGPVGTRAADLRQELELAKQLSADGTPFLLVGDFNDGHDGNQDAKSILTPTMSDAGTQAPIDHIFGAGVTFTGTETDRSTQSKKISDHPLAMATFTAQGSSSTSTTVTNVSATSTSTSEGCGCPTTGTSTGGGTWPAGTVAGSDDAIRATHAILLSVGFTEQDALLMTAIAGPESGWNPDAEAPGSSATGLFQILQSHDPSANLHDPVVNAQWAKKLFDASGNANPWQGWPESPLSYPPWVPMSTHNAIETNFNEAKARVERVLGTSITPIGSTGTGETCNVADTSGGVSGDLLNRLKQRAEMVIALAQKYPGGPGCVPGFNDQGVFPCGAGWDSACTAISMMIYGNNYVGSGDGGERAYGSVVQGQQGSTWPPPPGAIVSWPYSGSGHVAIYLGNGDWVDNWGPVGHNAHTQVEKGATAHWLIPPASFEGSFLNNGVA